MNMTDKEFHNQMRIDELVKKLYNKDIDEFN